MAAEEAAVFVCVLNGQRTTFVCLSDCLSVCLCVTCALSHSLSLVLFRSLGVVRKRRGPASGFVFVDT